MEFDTSKGPVMGQVMNLELDTVGCVIYGDALAVQEGDTVKATTRLLEVPAGHGLLGRVVDPLGNPLDGGPAIEAEAQMKLDIVAPALRSGSPSRTHGHRYQGDRLHDSNWPGPAGTHHW